MGEGITGQQGLAQKRITTGREGTRVVKKGKTKVMTGSLIRCTPQIKKIRNGRMGYDMEQKSTGEREILVSGVSCE